MTKMHTIFNQISPAALGLFIALALDIHDAEALVLLALN
jgi:hypothetical protein